MFDSLKHTKTLEKSGLPRNQAETYVQILSDVIGDEMATKNDVKSLETATKHYIRSLEISFKQDIYRIENSLREDFRENLERLETRIRLRAEMSDIFKKFEDRIVFKLGSLMVILLGGSIAVMSLMLP